MKDVAHLLIALHSSDFLRCAKIDDLCINAFYLFTLQEDTLQVVREIISEQLGTDIEKVGFPLRCHPTPTSNPYRLRFSA